MKIRNKKAVSHVIGFIFMMMLISTTSVAVIYTSNLLIDNKTRDAAEILAQDVANIVADNVMGAVTARRSLPESTYDAEIDIPPNLAGRGYYVEITDSVVFVNTSDGCISKNSTNYNAEEFEIGISGRVSGSNGKIRIFAEKTTDVFKFDFGDPDSEISLGYRGIFPETGIDMPDWDPPGSLDLTNWYYRIPIVIKNVLTETELKVFGLTTMNLTDYTHAIYLYPDNFDYIASNKDGSDLRFVAFKDDGDGYYLKYWTEYWNPCGVSKIWIKLESDVIGKPFLLHNETKTIYLYYGNSESTTKHYDAEDVFQFYDNFTTTLDRNTWIGVGSIVTDEDGSYVKIPSGGCLAATQTSGGFLETICPSTQPATADNFLPERFSSYTSFMVEAKMRLYDHESSNTDENMFVMSQFLPTLPVGTMGFAPGTNVVLDGAAPKQISDLTVGTGGDVVKEYEYVPPPPNIFIPAVLNTPAKYLHSYGDGSTCYRLTAVDKDNGALHHIVDLTADQEIFCTWIEGDPPFIASGWKTASEIRTIVLDPIDSISAILDSITPVADNGHLITNVQSILPKFEAYNIVLEYPYDTYRVNPDHGRDGFVVRSSPQPIYFYGSSYGVKSLISPGVDPMEHGERGLVLTKYKATNPDIAVGHGNRSNISNNKWHMVRTGVVIGESFNRTDMHGDPEICGHFYNSKKYIILGVSRFNCTVDGDIGNLQPGGYITNVIDTEDDLSIELAEGDPFTEGVIVFGCDIFNDEPEPESYMEVDWVRIYQSLMYNLNTTFGIQESKAYGWDSNNMPDPSASSYAEGFDNKLLYDVIYDDESAMFTVKFTKNSNHYGETDGKRYTATLTLGNEMRNHYTNVEISVLQPGGDVVNVHAEDEQSSFTQIPIVFDIKPSADDEIDVTFTFSTVTTPPQDSGNRWAVCALTVEEGTKSIQIEV
jgi:hypothetical protein